MAEQEQNKIKPVRRATTPTPGEVLPYCVELWDLATKSRVDRVLARAYSAMLARAIYMAAVIEQPGRRITLRHGERILADSE
jgi:hypothetical protein